MHCHLRIPFSSYQCLKINNFSIQGKLNLSNAVRILHFLYGFLKSFWEPFGSILGGFWELSGSCLHFADIPHLHFLSVKKMAKKSPPPPFSILFSLKKVSKRLAALVASVFKFFLQTKSVQLGGTICDPPLP